MIDDKWIALGTSLGTLIVLLRSHLRNQRDIKGINQKNQTRHDALLSVLRSSDWSDTKAKQDSIAKLS